MNTSLRKRPQVDLLTPSDLAELGRDLAFMQRRLATIEAEDLEIQRRVKEVRAALRREVDYLEKEIARIGEAVIYQFKLTDVTYEQEVEEAVKKLVEIDSDQILEGIDT